MRGTAATVRTGRAQAPHIRLRPSQCDLGPAVGSGGLQGAGPGIQARVMLPMALRPIPQPSCPKSRGVPASRPPVCAKPAEAPVISSLQPACASSPLFADEATEAQRGQVPQPRPLSQEVGPAAGAPGADSAALPRVPDRHSCPPDTASVHVPTPLPLRWAASCWQVTKPPK